MKKGIKLLIIAVFQLIILSQVTAQDHIFGNRTKRKDLKAAYEIAKREGSRSFVLKGYCIPKHLNGFLKKHPDVGIANSKLFSVLHYGEITPAISNLKLFFKVFEYPHYPEEYNTPSEIERLKDCYIYDIKTKEYKKARWSGNVDNNGYAEGYGTGFFDISYPKQDIYLNYGGMIEGVLENGKPNGFCDVKLTTLEKSSFGEKFSYFRYSGKFSNGKKDGELLLELDRSVSLKSVKNIKYILATFSNDYGVGTGYLFNSNGDVIGKGRMNKNGQIDVPRLNNDDIETIIRVVGVVVGAKALLHGGIKAMQYVYKKHGISSEGTKYSYTNKDNEYFTILDKGWHDIRAEKMSYTTDDYASIFIKDGGFFSDICKDSFYLRCYKDDKVIFETGEWDYSLDFAISSKYDFPAILEIRYKTNCSDDKYQYIKIKIKKGANFWIYLKT